MNDRQITFRNVFVSKTNDDQGAFTVKRSPIISNVAKIAIILSNDRSRLTLMNRSLDALSFSLTKRSVFVTEVGILIIVEFCVF